MSTVSAATGSKLTPSARASTVSTATGAKLTAGTAAPSMLPPTSGPGAVKSVIGIHVVSGNGTQQRDIYHRQPVSTKATAAEVVAAVVPKLFGKEIKPVCYALYEAEFYERTLASPAQADRRTPAALIPCYRTARMLSFSFSHPSRLRRARFSEAGTDVCFALQDHVPADDQGLPFLKGERIVVTARPSADVWVVRPAAASSPFLAWAVMPARARQNPLTKAVCVPHHQVAPVRTLALLGRVSPLV